MEEWILKGTDVRRWYEEGEVAVHALNGPSYLRHPRKNCSFSVSRRTEVK